MKNAARVAASVSVAALIAGCSASQSPTGMPDAMSQTSAGTALNPVKPSASYKVLHNFTSPRTGEKPTGGLLDISGTLYGTTVYGGPHTTVYDGTVYGLSTSGVYSMLHSFKGGSDGSDPNGALIDVNGTLYGTTHTGGVSHCNYENLPGCGTVYSISTSGHEKVLYAFNGGTDGANPSTGLVAVNGTLYGTTASGGGSGCAHSDGCGTVFSITTSGKETVLHSFANGSDGALPNGELLDVNGVLYGTTSGGGSPGAGCYDGHYGISGCGTLYTISTSGNETVLYAFKGGPDAANPQGGLIEVKGMLYGASLRGGMGCVDAFGCGTIFEIGASGSGYKTLHRFQDSPDGAYPSSGLIEVQGALYGVTRLGGRSGHGTVYSMTRSGTETVLHNFYGERGVGPAGILTSVNRRLYGTTFSGGGGHGRVCILGNCGTVYTLLP